MLIALEGIDGAGKSTVAREVTRQLQQASVDASFIDRKAWGGSEPGTAARTETLAQLIWGGEASEDLFGPLHWIFLIASWYAALERTQPWPQDPDSVVVVDGWYYRPIAKTVVRAGADPAWLDSLFEFAVTPEIVVLLDVAPATAWARGTAFTEAEIGRWDGYHGAPDTAFCTYQGRIREELVRMAKCRNWIRFAPDRSAGVGAVSAQIVAKLLPRVGQPLLGSRS